MKPSSQGNAKPTAGVKTRRAPAGRLPTLQRELLLRLDHLRSAAREITRSYLANLEHDIIEIRETVESAKAGDGRKASLRKNTADRLSDVLDDLRLKPQKGRRSDLKKVERAIRELQRLLAKQIMTASRSPR